HNNAHRELGPSHHLEAILSIQEQRVVANDYTVRFRKRFYQLLPPSWPGLRGGKVVIESRLDGSMAIRFQTRYLPFKEVAAEEAGSAPEPEEQPGQSSGDAARQPDSPEAAEAGDQQGKKPGGRKPAQDHPWRKGF